MPRKTAPFIRLMRGYVNDPKTLCWNWQGQKYKSGYGWIKVFGKVVSAHRLSYELHNGPIQDGKQILHQCDNKVCINPDHLTQGTHKENMKEAAERGRMRSGINHPMRINGSSTKGINSPQALPVKVLGKKYGSRKEAERHLKLGSGTVAYWLKSNPNKAERITKEDYLNEKSM